MGCDTGVYRSGFRVNMFPIFLFPYVVIPYVDTHIHSHMIRCLWGSILYVLTGIVNAECAIMVGDASKTAHCDNIHHVCPIMFLCMQLSMPIRLDAERIIVSGMFFFRPPCMIQLNSNSVLPEALINSHAAKTIPLTNRNSIKNSCIYIVLCSII
jgi:hypothetical protein